MFDFSKLGIIGGGAGAGPGIYEQAALYMDFTQNAGRLSGAWSSAASLLTVVRASVAQMDTSDGWWGEFAANMPRLSDKGLLIEEARTNSCRNNTMQGTVEGSPGTLPTGWAIGGGANLTRTISIGTDQGMDYIDIRFQGQPSDGFVTIYTDSTTLVPAAPNDVWTASMFYKLVGGSLANTITWTLNLSQAGGVGTSNVILSPSNVWQRATVTRTMPVSTTSVFSRWAATYTTGADVDFTLRVGWPQNELGAFMTSPIRTTGVAVLRAADSVVVTTPPAFVFGSLYSEAQVYLKDAVADGTHLMFSDGTLNNRINLYVQSSTGRGTTFVATAGVSQFSGGVIGPVYSNGQIAKIAGAYNTNDGQMAIGGAASVVDTVLTLPIINTLRLGAISTINGVLGGYLRRLAIWPDTRLTAAQLQAITT